MRHMTIWKGIFCVLITTMFLVPTAMSICETYNFSFDSNTLDGHQGETLEISMPKVKTIESAPFGFIVAFGLDVDVKIVQLEPGEDYVDLEVLSQPFYIWENGITTINPGAFLRLYAAKGLFLPSLPICFGICSDWGIIGYYNVTIELIPD